LLRHATDRTVVTVIYTVVVFVRLVRIVFFVVHRYLSFQSVS
jgi:hypothetical protein